MPPLRGGDRGRQAGPAFAPNTYHPYQPGRADKPKRHRYQGGPCGPLKGADQARIGLLWLPVPKLADQIHGTRPHTQEDIVQAIVPLFAPAQVLAQSRFVRAIGIGPHGLDQVRLLHGDIRGIDQQFPERCRGAPMVGIRQAQLIDQPQMGPLPWQITARRVVHQPAEQRLTTPADPNGQLEVPEGPHAVVGLDQKLGGRRVQDLVRRGAQDHRAGQAWTLGQGHGVGQFDHCYILCIEGPRGQSGPPEIGRDTGRRSSMHGAERIIDASLNRSREALRVMEDIARFALDDAGLCGTLKGFRHDLRDAAGLLPFDKTQLVAHRDTPGDVGTAISTDAEMRREGLMDVAVAAAARLTESLRSIEEASKTFPGVPASAFEALRYRAYTLEKTLVLALACGGSRQWRLCVLITGALCAHNRWDRLAELAIEGGADCLQLREKTLPDREVLAMAEHLVSISAPRHVAVIVNDRVDIALACGAQGVHLGQHDLQVAEARRLTGRRLLVGVSTTNLDQARQAAHDGADYCGVGPMFASQTKHKPEISGPDYLKKYLADPVAGKRPHLAIGGIGLENVRVLAEAGCRGIAVSGAVCGSPDPAGVCRALRAALETTGAAPA